MSFVLSVAFKPDFYFAKIDMKQYGGEQILYAYSKRQYGIYLGVSY
jgi:hypothetical protein